MVLLMIVIGVSFFIGFFVASCLSETEKMTGKEFITSQRARKQLSIPEILRMESIIIQEDVWDEKAKFRIIKETRNVLQIDKDSFVEKKIDPIYREDVGDGRRL